MDLESSEKISPKEKTKLEQDNKSKFSLKDLGEGAFKGIRSGIPAGMTIGSALGLRNNSRSYYWRLYGSISWHALFNRIKSNF
jgi:hypothetical protein